jgi:hypothetical protein
MSSCICITLNSACKWSSILDNIIITIITITMVVFYILMQICRCWVANSCTSPCIYIYSKYRVSCFASACIGLSTVSSWICVTRNIAWKWRSAIKFKSIITIFTFTYVWICIQSCRCWVANRCTLPYIITYCKYRVTLNASAGIGPTIIRCCYCITLNSACKWITT